MNLASSLTTCLAIVALVGCTIATGADPITLRSLGKGGFSGIKEARQEVIKDKAAWEKLWTEHAKTPVPEVDFAKEMVIVATLGTKRTGGYSVEIVSAEPAGKKLRVTVKQASPPPGALAIQALTAPFHFVAVPRSDLEVEFLEPKAEAK